MIALAACGSAPSDIHNGYSPALSRPHLGPESIFHIRFRNNVDAYALVVRFWSYSLDTKWHIEGTDCLRPGEVLDSDLRWQNGSG
jgi:hypothetical protein